MHTPATPPPPATAARRWLGALLLLAGSASAHDTWFQPLPAPAPGALLLALGTGAQFPRQETALDTALVSAGACHRAGQPGAPAALRWVAYRDDAVLLRSTTAPDPGHRVSCWLQARPLPLELDERTAALYLDEVRALPAVRERWAALRARGVRWQEHYTKHARIELAGASVAADGGHAGPADARADAAEAPDVPLSTTPPGLDLQAELPTGPLRVGASVVVQLLRDGQPLAGLPLALRNDLSPLTLWHTSDAQGRVTLRLPLAARWLLTGVDLRASSTRPDAWDSRFVSLHLETVR